MLNGKNEQQEKFTVVPEYDGNGTRIGTTVLDSQGKPVDARGGQQAKAALPPKDKLVKGQTYPTPRGNAVWDGQQFNPV